MQSDWEATSYLYNQMVYLSVPLIDIIGKIAHISSSETTIQ